jgi:ferredoxin
MRATVDADLCTACGLCEEICPEVFEPNDEGIAEVKVDEIPPELEETARDAADQCPVEAITIEE